MRSIPYTVADFIVPAGERRLTKTSPELFLARLPNSDYHKNMGSCPTSKGDDRELFLAEVSDTSTLADRGRVPAQRTASRPRLRAQAEPLAVETQGNKITARATGVNRATLRDLASGVRAPEATLDLHRFTARDAERKLREFLAAGSAAGHHCVLVVSGRGNHSSSEPVLRQAIVDWIAGPMSRYALALTTATPRHGGDGAFYVLLRRR